MKSHNPIKYGVPNLQLRKLINDEHEFIYIYKWVQNMEDVLHNMKIEWYITKDKAESADQEII